MRRLALTCVVRKLPEDVAAHVMFGVYRNGLCYKTILHLGNPYLCVGKAVNALVSLHKCAGLSEPSLVAYGCDARKSVFG